MIGSTIWRASVLASSTSAASSLRWGIAQNLLRQFSRALKRNIVNGIRHAHNLHIRSHLLYTGQSLLSVKRKLLLCFIRGLPFRDNNLDRTAHLLIQIKGWLIPHGSDDLQVILIIQARRYCVVLA